MDLRSQVDSKIRSDFLARHLIDRLQHRIYKFHSKYTALSSHSTVPPFLPFNRIRIQLRCRNYLVMLIGSETPLNYQDVLCMTALITSISLETLADEQQWTYQNAKHAKPSKSTRSQAKNTPTSISYCKPEDLKRGFITGGLFRYSRHPNFACEQANWYFFYVFGCIATVCRVVFVGSEL